MPVEKKDNNYKIDKQNEVANKLDNLDEESEELKRMNREQFYNYILENFSFSGDASRLIDNILQFVEENYTEENVQYNVLNSLLDGTIGFTDNEIKKYICREE